MKFIGYPYENVYFGVVVVSVTPGPHTLYPEIAGPSQYNLAEQLFVVTIYISIVPNVVETVWRDLIATPFIFNKRFILIIFVLPHRFVAIK